MLLLHNKCNVIIYTQLTCIFNSQFRFRSFRECKTESNYETLFTSARSHSAAEAVLNKQTKAQLNECNHCNGCAHCDAMQYGYARKCF